MKYAVVSTRQGFGPSAATPGPVEPPIGGAFQEGTFRPADDGTDYLRFVVELHGLADLNALLSRSPGLILHAPRDAMAIYGPQVLDGVEGLIEVYDAYRE